MILTRLFCFAIIVAFCIWSKLIYLKNTVKSVIIIAQLNCLL